MVDLGCLEGLYCIEFARHGAEVVGIEGREANIEKARFAHDVLALNNITLVQDDVRNLSVEKYGRFDVVLCLGILYHLDVPDVFRFVERMSDICRRVAIIDTHIGIRANRSHVYDGQEYHGWSYTEFPPESTKEERLKAAWASLDNEKSFWFTRPSLFNVLSRAGFATVYTTRSTPKNGIPPDRESRGLPARERRLFVRLERMSLKCTEGLSAGSAGIRARQRASARSMIRALRRSGGQGCPRSQVQACA